MVKTIKGAASLAAVFGLLAASPAWAAIAVPAGVSAHAATVTPVDYKVKHRFAVRGRVHPLAHQQQNTNYGIPDLLAPWLYNAPHQYDPTGFPYDDYPRQYYPGLGLYR